MELYIQRHAIAVVRGTEGYEHDGDRPLTPKGAKRMKQIAAGMKALGLSFDLILSSPLVRARQTAEIVADTFDIRKKFEFCDPLSTDGDNEEVVAEIAKREASCNSILLVGHEPSLSGLISVLLAGDERIPITMKKGGLCKLAVHSVQYGRCATLEWLLTPRQLTSLR